MASTYTQYPPKGGVPTYANLAAFPAMATNGSLAVALDTGSLYEYNANIPGWQLIGPEAAGGGTVTSVGLSAPSIFTVSGSPVISAGTLTFSLNTQSANTVFAGPSSGPAAAPTFRPLVAGDIPSLPYAQDAFTIIQTDSGTSPTATTTTSTLTFTNTDGFIAIVGNSLTNTVTLNTTGLQPSGNYITALTGDGTASGPGSAAFTLATVNSSVGSFGSASSVGLFTVNAKGLITAANSLSIQIAESQVTNLVSDLAGKQPVGNYITALTGDITASGPGSVAATLATVNGSPGSFTYASITVNAKGLVTAASSGTAPTTYTFANSLVNTAGTVTLKNDSASPGTSNYYGTNGAGTLGYFALPATSGANTALSNLASVAINTALLSASNNTIDLGSAANTFRTAYLGTELFIPLIEGLTTGSLLTLRGGVAASNAAGGAISLLGAAGSSVSTGGDGGAVTINGGAANGDNTVNRAGGAINITAGSSKGSNTGGTAIMSSGTGGVGTGTAGATGGTTNINGGTGGAGSATSGNGGGATLKAGSGGGGVGGGNGGDAQLVGGTGGTGSSTGGNGGAANVTGGSPGSVAGANGGSVTISSAGGTGTGTGGNGGSITISTGIGNGDNTVNHSGGSLTLSVGHSAGSGGGSAVTITAGTGGPGTATTGATGGNTAINAGAGGVGSATGGGGGNTVIQAGAGGASGSPGAGGFIQFLTASTTSFTEKIRILAAGGVNIVNGMLNVTTVGNGLAVASGSNAKIGTAVLAAGVATVSNTGITANSRIFVTSDVDGGTPGFVRVTAKTVGTGFTITSSSLVDTSTIAWLIVESI